MLIDTTFARDMYQVYEINDDGITRRCAIALRYVTGTCNMNRFSAPITNRQETYHTPIVCCRLDLITNLIIVYV